MEPDSGSPAAPHEPDVDPAAETRASEDVERGAATGASVRGAAPSSWWVALVLAVFLVFVSAAAAVGVTLGNREPDATAGSVQAALVQVLGGLNETPDTSQGEQAYYEALAKQVDTVAHEAKVLKAEMAKDPGPYSFSGFPEGSPSKESVVAFQKAVAEYMAASGPLFDDMVECGEKADAAEVAACRSEVETRAQTELAEPNEALGEAWAAIRAQAAGAQLQQQ